MSLSNSTIDGCVATSRSPLGGGVYAYFANVSVVGSVITRNSVVVAAPTLGPFDRVPVTMPFGTGAGGGLFLYAASLIMTSGSEVRRYHGLLPPFLVSAPVLFASLLTREHTLVVRDAIHKPSCSIGSQWA